MIETLAAVAIFIFSVVGVTGAVMLGADAMQDKGVPKAVGVGILTATVLLLLVVIVWAFTPGVIV